jgi:hypothetical protein
LTFVCVGGGLYREGRTARQARDEHEQRDLCSASAVSGSMPFVLVELFREAPEGFRERVQAAADRRFVEIRFDKGNPPRLVFHVHLTDLVQANELVRKVMVEAVPARDFKFGPTTPDEWNRLSARRESTH